MGHRPLTCTEAADSRAPATVGNVPTPDGELETDTGLVPPQSSTLPSSGPDNRHHRVYGGGTRLVL